MAEIIDFNRGREEEIMDLSEFGTFVANEAETMINEKGPFNDPDEADGFCDAFTELGMIACHSLIRNGSVIMCQRRCQEAV